MKFDVNKYKGKYVMHCKTEEEAKDFCNYLHSVGRKWRTDRSYHIIYNYVDENTVYYFNEGTYSDVVCAKAEGYTILEWEDFMKKKFTKADIRDGMVVELRNGAVYMVMGNVLMNFEDCLSLTPYNDTLETTSDCLVIDKVYKSGTLTMKRYFEHSNLILIWERPNLIKEMTVDEIEKELGYKIKIVGDTK